MGATEKNHQGSEFHLGSISHIFEKKFLDLNYVKRNLSVSEIRRIEMCAAQYLPGTASLIEEIDKKLMVLLRDGRTLIGYLRSVDQFANLVLHRTIERIHVGSEYGDIPRGIFIVRGENVVLLGEIDDEKEANMNLEEILEAQSRQLAEKEEQDSLRSKVFKERGLTYTSESIMDEHY